MWLSCLCSGHSTSLVILPTTLGLCEVTWCARIVLDSAIKLGIVKLLRCPWSSNVGRAMLQKRLASLPGSRLHFHAGDVCLALLLGMHGNTCSVCAVSGKQQWTKSTFVLIGRINRTIEKGILSLILESYPSVRLSKPKVCKAQQSGRAHRKLQGMWLMFRLSAAVKVYRVTGQGVLPVGSAALLSVH